MKVFYRHEQTAQNADSFSPSAGKPKLAVQDWLYHGLISQSEIESFEPATRKQIAAAHSSVYVDAVLDGAVENGFGNFDEDVAKSLPYTVGSLLAATEYAIAYKTIACSPTSGFHHAGHHFGGGYCTFNGLMVAAIAAHASGMADRILIVDMDQHYGNGTEDILKTLRIDYVDHITADKSYRTSEQAMRMSNLKHSLIDRKYDLIIYQAGADIHVDDPLGGLLTTEQMRERDRNVFLGGYVYHGTPIVWNLAGGYKRDESGSIEPVLKLHRQTVEEALRCL